MTLKAAIAADAATVFTDTAAFAETVTYYPRLFKSGDNRQPRTIAAVVIREQMRTVTEDGGESITPVFEVHVSNNSTTGIAATELDTGGDKISMPVRDGMQPSKRAVMRLITQDNGMLVLECR